MEELPDDNTTAKNVLKWLKKILVNGDSYEPLDWSQVIKVHHPPYRYIISHKFLHINALGNKERCAVTMYLDDRGKVVKFNKWEQHEV